MLEGEHGRQAQERWSRRLWIAVYAVLFAGVLAWVALTSPSTSVRAPIASLAAGLAAIAVGVVLTLQWKRYGLTVIGLALAAPLLLEGTRTDEVIARRILVGIGLLVAAGAILNAWRSARQAPSDELERVEGRLRSAATAARAEIRFQQSWSHGYSGKLSLPAGAQVGAEKRRNLERRQVTYPEVVARLREFLELAVEARGEVAIGIDEMDKMESPEAAEQFLNEIKGIFGVEHCFYPSTSRTASRAGCRAICCASRAA